MANRPVRAVKEVRLKRIDAKNTVDVRPTQGSLELSASRWRSDEMLPFLENDEKIYIALVEQLDHKKGYTLHGHSILRESWINLQQYDHPLFFHPPGGLVFFWITYRI